MGKEGKAMQRTKMRTMPIGMAAAVAAVAGFMLVDASHADIRERRTRTTVPTQELAPAPAPRAAPAPAAAPASPVCTVTEVLPAPEVSMPVVSAPPPERAYTDGRQRRTRTTQTVTEVAPAPAPQPIVITRIVPCPTEQSAEAPQESGGASYTPGLLSPTLIAASPTPGIDSLIPEDPTIPTIGVQQVPEPSVLALFGVGALGIAIARRRRRG